MQLQFKCKNCGKDMVFDPKTVTLSCPACGSKEQLEDAKVGADYSSVEQHIDEHFYTDQDGQQEYHCQNCGAKIITNSDTTATNCSFCGSAVVLSDQLQGSYKPDKVIPFRITREEAEEAYRKWSSKLLLAPGDFKKDMRIKELSGIYVPFWLCDMAGQGEAFAHATRVHTHHSGDDEIIETDHYDVYRKVDLRFDKIPFDASEKMEDTLMDKMEPFDYKELHTFDTPYLAGYLAEKYDYTTDDMKERIDKRVDKYTEEYIRDTMTRYDSFEIVDHEYKSIIQGKDYTMVPVWMVYSAYGNSGYTFAMNGQTGKIAGDPPIDGNKAFGLGAGVTILIFAVLRIITMLMGGPLL